MKQVALSSQKGTEHDRRHDTAGRRRCTAEAGQQRGPASRAWPLTPPHLYLWTAGTASAAAALTVAAQHTRHQIVSSGHKRHELKHSLMPSPADPRGAMHLQRVLQKGVVPDSM